MSWAVVIVGCGWAGLIHARSLARRQDVRVAAVVDQDMLAARRLADELGVPAYPSVDSVLAAQVAFDGAVVATPTETHVDLCRQLALAGKHVFCEKPLTTDVAQALRLQSVVERRGVRIVLNYNQRFAAPIQKLKEHLGTDRAVRQVNIAMFQHPPQVDSATHPYFLVTDACCHLIDTLLFLNGPIAQVHAYGAHGPRGLLFDVAVAIRFANGSVGTLAATFWGGVHDSQHPFFHLQLVTEQARYVVDNLCDGLSIFPHDELCQRRWTPSVFTRRDYEATMCASLDAWVDALAGREPLGATLAMGVQNVQVVDAVIRSLQTGQAVAIREAVG